MRQFLYDETVIKPEKICTSYLTVIFAVDAYSKFHWSPFSGLGEETCRYIQIMLSFHALRGTSA